jgi:hypothetical protein
MPFMEPVRWSPGCCRSAMKKTSIGEAIALQVVARYGGTISQPELLRYVNLVEKPWRTAPIGRISPITWQS